MPRQSCLLNSFMCTLSLRKSFSRAISLFCIIREDYIPIGGFRYGKWFDIFVFLQVNLGNSDPGGKNVHLTPTWLRELEKEIYELQPHPILPLLTWRSTRRSPLPFSTPPTSSSRLWHQSSRGARPTTFPRILVQCCCARAFAVYTHRVDKSVRIQ